MKAALTELLHNPLLWQGDRLARAEDAIASGFVTLDRELPGGGWPQGALIEVLQPQAGLYEWGLIAPALAAAQAIPVPVGYRPMPRDGFPVLGYPEPVPNLYLALMHSGVTLAPLVGELAAMEIVDGAWVQLLDAYRPERFW